MSEALLGLGDSGIALAYLSFSLLLHTASDLFAGNDSIYYLPFLI